MTSDNIDALNATLGSYHRDKNYCQNINEDIIYKKSSTNLKSIPLSQHKRHNWEVFFIIAGG